MVHVWRAPSKGKAMEMQMVVTVVMMTVVVEVVMMVIEGMLAMVRMVLKPTSHLFCALSEPGSPLSTEHINLWRPPIPFYEVQK